jgi:hypothetical protein
LYKYELVVFYAEACHHDADDVDQCCGPNDLRTHELDK